ncbi:MAG TPA: prepilin-type N-terminal cleavage/methylation domain-containing protein [Verrucomicrobiae bacterium]|jgi:prepilin-type N-terminal cleavage/methylation domain-containing protein|nr:prepilin-type N-terminal cleavage/methylation domain-containing protein [Verrucomicrobiae bacterium]
MMRSFPLKSEGARCQAAGQCRPGRSFAGAFTLIEIMIVVAIMGIILAAGIPSLYGFFHKEGLRKTTGDIVETCQSARSTAILTGSPTDLVFHPRDGTCETASAGGGYGSWAHSAKIENCTIEMLDVNLQECKDFDTVKVRFFPNGTCDEMTLVLRSNNNEWRKISLEITTALPSVSDHIQ